jgi:hypothetical protein
MTQQHTIVKENNLQRAEGLWRLPVDDLSHSTSQPHPAANYAEAVQRV